MRLSKSIAYLSAIAVCALAACNAHAQTNAATFNATLFVQQPLVSGVKSASIASKSTVLNTGWLISELSMATGTNFSKAAKLAVISGGSSQFAIIDGTNTTAIPTNIINIYPVNTTNVVDSGMENSKTEILKEQMIFELDFNDFGMGASEYQFSLRGLGSVTMTYTASGVATLAKINMFGDGTQYGTNHLVAIASLSGSGKATP